MGDNQLKPCPFCGSDDVGLIDCGFPGGVTGFSVDEAGHKSINLIDGEVIYSVHCFDCHAEIGIEANYLTEIEAVEAWNNRV